MRHQEVQSSQAPAPIGPYSQAVRAGNLLFISGQIALDPSTGDLVPGGVAAETEQVLTNLAAILLAAGADFAAVVRVEVFVTNLADFAQINTIYSRYFAVLPLPARYVVQVAALPKGAQIEIAATALCS